MDRKDWAKKRAEELRQEYKETGDMLAYVAGIGLSNLINNFSFNFVATGDTGVGKSTLVGDIALMMDPEITPEENYAFTLTQFIQKARTLPQYTVLVPDEGIMAYKRRSLTRGNMDAVELVNKYRYKHVAIGWAIPYFGDLDKGVRKHVKIWALVVKRGVAVALLPDRNPFLEDPWHLDQFAALFQDALKDKGGMATEPDDVLTALLSFPNALKKPLRFGALPKDFDAEYQKLSTKAKEQLERESREVYVTVSQAAQIMDVPVRRVWELVANDEIRYEIGSMGVILPLRSVLDKADDVKKRTYVSVDDAKLTPLAVIANMLNMDVSLVSTWAKRGKIPKEWIIIKQNGKPKYYVNGAHIRDVIVKLMTLHDPETFSNLSEKVSTV